MVIFEEVEELIDNQLYTSAVNCAIYCRLSRDDIKNGYDESITIQKESLSEYVLARGWNIYDVYIDDNVSGTTFDRQEFQRMMRDIKAGNVNCVVTKDLSRLGRDYIETGNYLEKIFPSYGVRYIAVNDMVDTRRGIDDIIPFKNVINDMYARDMSRKIRSSLMYKKGKGLYLGAYPPYGYVKDPNDKNRLLVANDITTEAVKRIFELYLEGYGQQKIAKILNEEGYPSPAAAKGIKRSRKVTAWNYIAVHRILTNEVYIGTLVQHKRERASYKTKKIYEVPKDEWIKIPNAVEPIIDKDIFFEVQKISEKRSTTVFRPGHVTHLFSGKARCGDCGASMGYFYDQDRSVPCWKLICGTFRKYGASQCSMHSMPEYVLKDLILEDLKGLADFIVDEEEVDKVIKRAAERDSKAYEEELKNCEDKMSRVQNILKQMYYDRVDGIITQDEFKALSQELQREMEGLRQRYNKIVRAKKHEDKNTELKFFYDRINEILKMRELTRPMVELLIDYIEIFNDHIVKVHYRFPDPRGS